MKRETLVVEYDSGIAELENCIVESLEQFKKDGVKIFITRHGEFKR